MRDALESREKEESEKTAPEERMNRSQGRPKTGKMKKNVERKASA